MSGETIYAQTIVRDAMKLARQDPAYSEDAMGRAIIDAVLAEYRRYRSVQDIGDELRYIVDTIDEDEFVITRGC